MIFRILENSATFAGVDYSEKKNERGEGQLKAAENFGALLQVGTKESYVKYLESVSKKNSNVKLPQFHAIVSGEGKKESYEELIDAAKKYMRYMGYGDNPYLIYSHHDTDNNHVHIVSTRVDKKGNKIDQSFEHLRSQRFRKLYMKIDYGRDSRAAIERALEYRFSTKAQFGYLLEGMGYKISFKPSWTDVIKGGELVHKVPDSNIAHNIGSWEKNPKEAGRLRAIFAKYSPGTGYLDFKEIMRAKFGVEIIYNYPKGNMDSTKTPDILKKNQKINNSLPIGYTIIDHNKKIAYKGSGIMPLKKLMSLERNPAPPMRIYDLLGDITPTMTFSEAQHLLNRHGYNLRRDNNIIDKKSDTTVTRLGKAQSNRLRYNERLQYALQFSHTGSVDPIVLAQLFAIDQNSLKDHRPDFKLSRSKKKSYRNRALLLSGQKDEYRENPGETRLMYMNGSLHLIDFKKKYIMDTKSDLGIAPVLHPGNDNWSRDPLYHLYGLSWLYLTETPDESNKKSKKRSQFR